MALISFLGVCVLAWKGALGLKAIGLLFLSVGCFFTGKNGPSLRKTTTQVAKFLFTVAGIMALLRHPIPCPPMPLTPVFHFLYMKPLPPILIKLMYH